MPHHALLRPRRRALPALAALIACAALSGAPGSASAADPGLTLTALSPASWWQADGTFRVPLRLQVGELITIDHLEIEVVGLPGVITVAAPAGLVSVLEGAGLSIDLPGVAGNRTIRVTAFVVGQPSYGIGPTIESVTAQTVVTLAPPGSGGSGGSPGAGGSPGSGGSPGAGGSPGVTPISNLPTGAPLVGPRAVKPKILLLRIRTIKGKRYAFVKSSAAVKLQLVANRRVGKKWRAAKRVGTSLVANRVRRVPLKLATPGRYVVRAVIRNGAGLTGTRSVKLVLRVPAPR